MVLLEDYESKMRQYEKTMKLAEELVQQIYGVSEMLKIKGVGLVLAAGFMAKVGDISRFDHQRQI
jgi:transposase